MIIHKGIDIPQATLNKGIEEAVGLYKEIEQLTEIKYQKQIRIAEICIEICDIRQNNGNSGAKSSKYNLSSFAKDTMIPRSSLKEWVDTYRRVIPVVGPINSDKDWNRARKVAASNRIKTNPTETKIKESFNEPPAKTEFFELCKLATRLTKFFRTRDLRLIKDHELIGLMNKLDEVSDTINTHLTKKASDSGRKQDW